MPQTVVRLNLPPERVLVMQPTFLNAGRNPRQVQARRRDDVVSYALGPMAPFDHVALRLKVIVDKGEDPPATEILKEIAVAKGEAQQGDAPKTTVIARILLGFFTTDPKDSLEMLADAFLDGVTGKDVALDREFDQSEADLALSVSTSGCDQQRPGGPCHMTITVDNHGPGDASDITLDCRVPADLTVLSSTLEIDDYRPTMAELAKEFRGGKTNTTATAYLSPHCTRQGENAVRCAIKSLMPGRSAVARLSLRLPPGAVPECRAEVSSPRTDPDPADNTIAFSMPRKEPAPSRPPAFRQQGAVVRPPGNEFAGTWVLDQDGNRRARILINPDLPRQARKTASQGPISIEASSSIALLTNRFNPVKNTASLQ